MTFRKSIIISFALHLVLFGGGLAFARFSGLLSWGHREPIMVTLVGDGGNSMSSGKHGRQRNNLLPAPQPAGLPPLSEAAPDRESAAMNASYGQAGTGGEAGSGEGTGPGDGRAGGSSSGSVSPKQWAVIVSSIERVKSYPHLARERGIQGTVRLRFRVKPEGEVERVEIVKSSGHEILDTASIRTLYRAAPMPYVNGWLEVPVSYVLK